MPIAGKILDPVRSLPRAPVIVAGSYLGNGSSSPTSISFPGVSAVTRTGAGVCTFPVPGNPSDSDVIFAMAVLNGPTPRMATVEVSEGVATVSTYNSSATATDATSNDLVEVFFLLKTNSAL